ncbi:hypothetical protein GQ600_7951 [Phytophthora cactorum]|nr:hypothetical protein GQ600_7951 [Phytophthora cactorum]
MASRPKQHPCTHGVLQVFQSPVFVPLQRFPVLGALADQLPSAVRNSVPKSYSRSNCTGDPVEEPVRPVPTEVFAVGDELWAQGEQPHELAFVLCGGFLARNMEEITQTSTTTDIFETEKPKPQVLSEKMIKPGGSLAAFSVLKGTPLPYAVVTTRFKSILLSLPSHD